MANQRISHGGGAVDTTISGGINAVVTTWSIAASSGWPDGSVGPFWAVIDAGTASEEKVLITSRSGTTITGATRGQDGTSATSHSSGATFSHIFSAQEADEANALVKATLGTVTTKGDMIVATAPSTLGRLPAGADGLPLVASSSQSTGLQYAAISAAGLQSLAVTTAKLADLAVQTAKLDDLSVTTAKLADTAVTTAKITDANVTTAKIADANVTTAKILDANVTTAKIADANVTLAKFASGIRPVFEVADATALAALTPTEGDLAFQADLNYLLVYDGAAWVGTGANGRTKSDAWGINTGSTSDATGSSFALWPTDNTTNVAIPPWAKYCEVSAQVLQVKAVTADGNFNLRTEIGTTLSGTQRRFRIAQNAFGDCVLPSCKIDVSSVAGTTKAFRTTAAEVGGGGAALRTVNGESAYGWSIKFTES